MELEHSFIVPVPRERAWDVLLDVERVASCMPGATLDSVDGDEIHGRIKVKVGPITMAYAGTARFTDQDAAAGVVTLEASGKETRGAGTASATVRSELEDRGDETQVTVHTTLNVTGKPAQFGRGVMAEVSGKLLNIFATNLAATLAEPEHAATADGDAAVPGDRAAASGGSAAGNGAASGGSAAGNGAAGGGAASGGSAAGNGAEGDSAAGGPGAGERAATSGAGAEPAPGPGGSSQDSGPGTDASAPVAELGLPARATGSLNRDGVTTVGQLAARTEDQLLAIEGIGPASVEEIKAKLAERGLSLGRPAPGAGTTAASGSAAAGPSASSKAAATGAPAAKPAASRRATAAPVMAGDDEALNLLKVAGMPVLKRAVPVLAGLVAAGLIGFRKRMRKRKQQH